MSVEYLRSSVSTRNGTCQVYVTCVFNNIQKFTLHLGLICEMQAVTSGRPINPTHAFDERLIYKPFKQQKMFVLLNPIHYVVMTLITPRPL